MSVLRARVRVGRRTESGEFVLDAEIEAGPGITVVSGPSGAGKTTLLLAIAGLLPPELGAVSLGEDVWFEAARRLDRPTHRRPLAMVLQDPALFPHLSVLANVEYGIDRALPRGERRRRASELLAQMNVAPLADRRPRGLSGGEAQRVAVARALGRAPRLLLLDEPFAALDRPLRRTLAELVRDRVRGLAIPVLFVTHDREEALLIGDRAVRLEAGVIAAAGPVAEVV